MGVFRLLLAGVTVLATSLATAEQAPDSIVQLAPSLQSWGQNPVVVDAVRSQNAKGLSLEQIRQRDAQWRATSGLDNEMQEMIEGTVGQELSRLESSKPYVTEIFVMDNQGANVAMSNKTSDYWQGDEAKFTESFKGGAGALHVGDVEFDESAQAYLVQVSVPVVDGGKAIGAMTIGINIDDFEAQ